jgi:hypothetical protein
MRRHLKDGHATDAQNAKELGDVLGRQSRFDVLKNDVRVQEVDRSGL